MPCLFSTSPNLVDAGPRITVAVMASSAFLKSLKDPEEIRKYDKQFSAVMLVDTGASCTMIDAAIAPFLGLTPHGTEKIITPSGLKDDCLTYDVDLIFSDHNIARRNLRVIESHLKQQQGIDGLIGRDILSNALLVYQGWANQYTLAF